MHVIVILLDVFQFPKKEFTFALILLSRQILRNERREEKFYAGMAEKVVSGRNLLVLKETEKFTALVAISTF